MNIGRENRFLLDLLRMGQGTVPLRLQEGKFAGSWAKLLTLARRHGIVPLLGDVLKRLPQGHALPDDVLDYVQQQYRAGAARNVRLYFELENVLARLSESRVRVVLLKGAHLAKWVYGNIALRTMDDIDLMVGLSDVSAACQALSQLGYQSMSCVKMDAKTVTFVRPGATPIEIHWGVERNTYGFQIDVGSLWSRSISVNVECAGPLVLCPEDLILHICLHTTYHHTGFHLGLRPLCDISAAVRHYRHSINWADLTTRADGARVGKGVYLALSLAHELVGVDIPEHALKSLRPQGFEERWAGLAMEQIFAAKTFSAESWRRAEFFSILKSAEPVLAKFHAFLAALFPAGRIVTGTYGVAPTVFSRAAWYCRRPFGLISRHGLKLLRFARGDGKCDSHINRRGELARWLLN